ncbi:hypothetical protein NKR23_g845 [Pleurostoma richardsiae]|uniref:Uncharacterized protein n=1 Tax=Pleurostoma richardsiae TaxID=41990 RepID=A0AA38RRS6_9PEZI|nr:hypothetical protein NKR23_g845 [Pleurostoma richardsiae]
MAFDMFYVRHDTMIHRASRDDIAFDTFDKAQSRVFHHLINFRRYCVLCKTRDEPQPTQRPRAIIWVFENSTDPWSILAFPPALNMASSSRTEAQQHYLGMTISEVTGKIFLSWQDLLAATHSHIRLLEDFIYDSPDADSCASELWKCSKYLRYYMQLLRQHREFLLLFKRRANTIRNRHPDINQATFDIELEIALSYLPGGGQIGGEPLQDHIENIQDTLNPTIAHMLDMIYKSAAIRDTQLSLRLNASLWRLSWITFIFLPLTFVSGFFGMNVDVFEHNPSILWYFIAAIVLLVTILGAWLLVKKLRTQRLGVSLRVWKKVRAAKDESMMV